MENLDDFMLFNIIEDAREEQERSATTEYPYQRQFWDDKEDTFSSSYGNDGTSGDDY